MNRSLETERLIIDRIRKTDRDDYFHCISHDRKVLETFICRYAETPQEVNLEPYIANEKMFAIRLKETEKLIGIILYFDEKDDSCEISDYGGEARISSYFGFIFWRRNTNVRNKDGRR